MLSIIANAFWLIAPAYAANAFPPLLNGKKPIDGGRYYKSKRILGDGKTWEGTIGGLVFGVGFGLLLLIFQPQLQLLLSENNISLVLLNPLAVFLLALGALLGDIVASFTKRRINIKRGSSLPLVDQLDFVFGSVLLASLVIDVPLYVFLFLLIITPIIHLIANGIGYFVGVKEHPW